MACGDQGAELGYGQGPIPRMRCALIDWILGRVLAERHDAHGLEASSRGVTRFPAGGLGPHVGGGRSDLRVVRD